MADPQANIHTTFEQLLSRQQKETMLGQRSICLWMTGLSGSGKTTIAANLEKGLHQAGFHTMVLDGDNVRSGLNRDLGFSSADRSENIRRIAEVAKLFVQNGIITICCFVSPTEELRQLARTVIGKDDFLEVFVDTPLEECERRDVKGLYAKARAGTVKDLTGISAPFEVPATPDITLKTIERSIEECTQELLNTVIDRIRRN